MRQTGENLQWQSSTGHSLLSGVQVSRVRIGELQGLSFIGQYILSGMRVAPPSIPD